MPERKKILKAKQKGKKKQLLFQIMEQQLFTMRMMRILC